MSDEKETVRKAYEKLIRQNNQEVITRNLDKLLLQPVQIGQESFSHSFNIKSFDNTNIPCQASIFADEEGSVEISIFTENNLIAQMSIQLGIINLDKDKRVCFFSSDIQSSPDYEGLGLSKALFQQTDSLFQTAQSVYGLKGILGIGLIEDRSRGKKRKRENWTSRQAREIGYTDDNNSVRKALQLINANTSDTKNLFVKFYT